MIRRLAFLFLAAPYCLAEPPEYLADFVASLAAEAIDARQAVGLSIGIAQGEETWLAEGYGLANLELNTPASAETVYRIGSITKPFTAAAIQLLAEDGMLKLDDALQRFLPDYPDPGGKATIAQLLQHTSGIKNLTSLPSYRPNIHLPLGREAMLARFKDLPLEFESGAQFRYSNSGYYLLGAVIEEAAEQSYGKFLQARIFDPLNLEATTLDHHGKIIPHRAAGYAKAWGKGGLRNADFLDMKQPFAAGALVSTVGDLLRWSRALAAGTLLSAEAWNRMTTLPKLKGRALSPYGSGVFVQRRAGRRVIRHGGGINGFRSEWMMVPESGIHIVVLANAESARTDQLAARIFRKLHPVKESNDE